MQAHSFLALKKPWQMVEIGMGGIVEIKRIAGRNIKIPKGREDE